jgi:itaconyl-CoA hydratase
MTIEEKPQLFAAFKPVSENRIREQIGLPFEDFAAGQVFHHRPGITVTQQDNINEALVTLNQAAIHYDDHYARATEFKKPLVVSTITLQRAVGAGWKTFGRRKRINGFSSIRLTVPIFGGDTLYASTRILETGNDESDPDCGKLFCEAKMTRADGTECAIVTYDQSIFRRGRGPFTPLGY